MGDRGAVSWVTLRRCEGHVTIDRVKQTLTKRASQSSISTPLSPHLLEPQLLKRHLFLGQLPRRAHPLHDGSHGDGRCRSGGGAAVLASGTGSGSVGGG